MTTGMASALDEHLPAVLGDVFGEPIGAPRDVALLSGGASSQLWAFSLPGHGRYVLRLAPPVATRVPMTTEAAAIAAAARAGVPVPAVVYATDEREPFGTAFLVMEHVEGETRPTHILRDPALADARRCFAADCGHALGAIARAEPPATLELVDQVAHYRSVLDDLGAAIPTFEWAFRVLETDRPPAPGRPAVVHGDFRLGNLLLDEGGLRAVLDWELVHLGDPVEDLGWLCAKAWRFGARPPVGGIGQRAELLDAYEEASGTRVDEGALAWWEAFSALKWGIICLAQASRHLVGGERSVELAAIGRRVAEVELDLLEALP